MLCSNFYDCFTLLWLLHTSYDCSTLALKQIFSRYGLALELVTDNDPQLLSKEFEGFLKSIGVKHIIILNYHPQSNGLTERNVQIFKEALRRISSDLKDNSTLSRKISRFLINYRSMPHSTTGLSPAELLLNTLYQFAFS